MSFARDKKITTFARAIFSLLRGRWVTYTRAHAHTALLRLIVLRAAMRDCKSRLASDYMWKFCRTRIVPILFLSVSLSQIPWHRWHNFLRYHCRGVNTAEFSSCASSSPAAPTCAVLLIVRMNPLSRFQRLERRARILNETITGPPRIDFAHSQIRYDHPSFFSFAHCSSGSRGSTRKHNREWKSLRRVQLRMYMRTHVYVRIFQEGKAQSSASLLRQHGTLSDLRF